MKLFFNLSFAESICGISDLTTFKESKFSFRQGFFMGIENVLYKIDILSYIDCLSSFIKRYIICNVCKA
ncbi:hypothetical protein WRSd3_p00011 (plasmid) [Shigella dysenteriae WRSd3]|uniref:Uncharacterized protein n=1 Tax=Shigella dysenteriae WRSd3 TaxID=1401327 RepID=A0A090N9B4_SHIDY|nr:hypothetical protein WRSd3_p00011 [Shigella dysenteriae WRSd3]